MPLGKPNVLIFISVLIVGFSIQAAMNSIFPLGDLAMWAKEIRYFIAQDPKQFDFNGAYGNPGTLVLELGTVLHTLFDISYRNAVTLSVSVLVALAVAACSVVCFFLQPDSLWWLATACTLLFNRLCISATPPTAVAIPLITLIVLAAWWLINQQALPAMKYFLGWGAAVGLACATRIEVSLLVSAPFSLLIARQHGRRTLLPMIAGALVVFFLSDPYLWLMPAKHLGDLVRRFTINYAQYPNMPIFVDEMVQTLWLAALSCGWCLARLMRRSLPRILPGTIIVALSAISLLMLIVVFSSNYKPSRYFIPVAVVWEVILLLLALEAAEVKVVSDGGSVATRTASYWMIALFAFVQLSYDAALYLYFH